MKRRDNNRGFTLVELIVAIAILAIAALPLVSNFIQSSKMNLEGRKSLNAMNLAQGMMEGMSAYKADGIDELIQEAALSGDSGAETPEGEGEDVETPEGEETESELQGKLIGTIFPKASKYKKVEVLRGSGWAYPAEAEGGIPEEGESGGASEAIKPDKTKPYGYLFKEVEMVVGDTYNTYDVQLVLDPTGSDQEAFNNREIANISEVNQYYDAVFTMPASEVNDAITDLRKDSSDSSISADAYKGNIARTTNIEIKNNSTNPDKPNFTVEVIREYRPLNPSSFGLAADASAQYGRNINISKLESDKLPRGVYFYFEGMENAKYDNADTANARETIKVTNTTGEEIMVYLIRTQKVDIHGVADDSAKSYNDEFGCKVEVNCADEKVDVVSNLRFDLSPEPNERNVRTKDEDNNTLDLAGTELENPGEGEDALVPCYKSDRAVYYYNDEKINEEMYKKHFYAGYQKDLKNSLYKVEINIFEPGTYGTTEPKLVAKYDGGLIN